MVKKMPCKASSFGKLIYKHLHMFQLPVHNNNDFYIDQQKVGRTMWEDREHMG